MNIFTPVLSDFDFVIVVAILIICFLFFDKEIRKLE